VAALCLGLLPAVLPGALVGLPQLVRAAVPQEASARLDLGYEARFLGLPVGSVAVHLTRTDGRYGVEVNGRAAGLYWLLKGVRVHRIARGQAVETPGKGAEALPLQPEVYRDAFLEWDDAADTIVTFVTDDGIPTVMREGTVSDRVPFEQRPGTIDPITAILIARQRIAEAAVAERRDAMQMVFPVLEGKSRYDVTVEVAPPKRIETAGQSWNARIAEVTFEPIGGFSDKHAAEMRDGKVDIAFSDHVDAIPIRIDVDLGWGSFNLIYQGRCGSADVPCPKNEVDHPDNPLYQNDDGRDDDAGNSGSSDQGAD